MQILLLLLTKMYFGDAAHGKQCCLYRERCSLYVRNETQKGFMQGIKAFYYRYKRCRKGYLLFRNPLQDNPELLLVTGDVLTKDKIAEHIINFEPSKVP